MPDLTKVSNGTEVPLDADEIKEIEDFQKAWADGQSEREMHALRLERNRLLAETDWWSLPDSPEMTDAQAQYRDALRQLPATEEDPANPTWPTKPE
jgi:hypothetical protein